MKVTLDPRTCCAAHHAHRCIGQRIDHQQHADQRIDVARLDQPAGAAFFDQLGNAADAAADHRLAGGKRLEHAQWGVFVPLRGDHHRARAAHQLRELIAFAVTQQPDIAHAIAQHRLQPLHQRPVACHRKLHTGQHAGTHQGLDALLRRQPAKVEKIVAGAIIGLDRIGIDPVGNMREALGRPSPFDELFQKETTRHDDAFEVVAIAAKQPVDHRLKRHHRAGGQRILDAAMRKQLRILPALAALAHAGLVVHLVVGTGDLQIVRSHHRRYAGLAQDRQDRG